MGVMYTQFAFNDIDVQIMKGSLYVRCMCSLILKNTLTTKQFSFLAQLLRWHVIFGGAKGGETGAVSTKCRTKVSVCKMCRGG